MPAHPRLSASLCLPGWTEEKKGKEREEVSGRPVFCIAPISLVIPPAYFFSSCLGDFRKKKRKCRGQWHTRKERKERRPRASLVQDSPLSLARSLAWLLTLPRTRCRMQRKEKRLSNPSCLSACSLASRFAQIHLGSSHFSLRKFVHLFFFLPYAWLAQMDQ